MLTKDRPEMSVRAVRSFQAQTYLNKKLMIVNGGSARIDMAGTLEPDFVQLEGMTVGALRNLGCRYASAHYAASSDRPEIFCHFDDDDLSHPRRIEEQVALLQSSGADAVGYNDMVFWDSLPRFARGLQIPFADEDLYGEEAWLYTNASPRYALGTSLCYWRKTWEKNPFADKQRGEDWDFVYGCVTVGVSSIPSLRPQAQPGCEDFHEPRMIASIHAGNARAYDVRFDAGAKHHWRRAVEFDEYARKAMQL